MGPDDAAVALQPFRGPVHQPDMARDRSNDVNHSPLPRSEQGEASRARELPSISRQEREFWRRAVDEQRARLGLVAASAGPASGAH